MSGLRVRVPRRRWRSARRTIPALIAVLAALGGCAVDGPVPPPLRDGRVLWSADLEGGDLTSFQSTPWNVVDAQPPKVVTSPVREGRYALAFTIPGAGGAGVAAACCGTRSEVEPKFRRINPGDDLWFGMSTYLAPGFPTDTHWQAIVQFEQNFDGPPPLGLYVEDGSYRIEGGYGNPQHVPPFNFTLAPAVTGTWSDWAIHVVFSPDPAKGVVEAWRDGNRVLSAFAPQSGTMYHAPSGPDGSYLKLGYYRKSEITAPGTVLFDDLRIGTTMGAVRHLDPID